MNTIPDKFKTWKNTDIDLSTIYNYFMTTIADKSQYTEYDDFFADVTMDSISDLTETERTCIEFEHLCFNTYFKTDIDEFVQKNNKNHLENIVTNNTITFKQLHQYYQSIGDDLDKQLSKSKPYQSQHINKYRKFESLYLYYDNMCADNLLSTRGLFYEKYKYIVEKHNFIEQINFKKIQLHLPLSCMYNYGYSAGHGKTLHYVLQPMIDDWWYTPNKSQLRIRDINYYLYVSDQHYIHPIELIDIINEDYCPEMFRSFGFYVSLKIYFFRKFIRKITRCQYRDQYVFATHHNFKPFILEFIYELYGYYFIEDSYNEKTLNCKQNMIQNDIMKYKIMMKYFIFYNVDENIDFASAIFERINHIQKIIKYYQKTIEEQYIEIRNQFNKEHFLNPSMEIIEQFVKIGKYCQRYVQLMKKIKSHKYRCFFRSLFFKN